MTGPSLSKTPNNPASPASPISPGSPASSDQVAEDLRKLGLLPGDTVMIHSSFTSLGPIQNGAAGFFEGLFAALGPDGTVILPAFSYDTVTRTAPIFDRASTSSCVGYLPEYFRTRVEGVTRSLHATHSLCVRGRLGDELIQGHELDLTPVGEHSPIRKLPQVGGKILFIGCSLNHNTAFHGIEEIVQPPYLFEDEPIHYELRDKDRVLRQTARHHSFQKNGFFYAQVYERILPLLQPGEYSQGKVLQADCTLYSAAAVWKRGIAKMTEEPLYFVDKVPVK